jgi:hypothetical protein
VPALIAMTDPSAQQIAATLSGHAGSPEWELRLLRLFQSEAENPRRNSSPEAAPASLPKAA